MKSVEFKEFIALLILLSSFIRVVRADTLFWLCRKEYEHNGLTVLAKLCLNLCSLNN